jgi:hypothetical protein
MKRLPFIFLALTIIFFSGCSFFDSKPYTVLGSWKLKRIVDKSNGNTETDQANVAAIENGNLLNIYRDKSFTLVGEKSLQLGVWSIDKSRDELTIRSRNNKNITYEVEFSTTNDEVELLKLHDESKQTTLVFTREAIPLNDLKNEPFHPLNMQWRVKATTSESDLQITQRLMNYIKHVSLILLVAKEQKLDVVSFELSQGPIRIFSNGIGIYPYDMVKTAWKNAYFNDEEAFKAHQIFENFLKNTKYNGSGTGKWVEDDYQLLTNIYKGLVQETGNIR